MVIVKIAVHRESRAGETRVALTPEAVKSLVAEGWEVVVEAGAGAPLALHRRRLHATPARPSPTSVAGDVNLRVNPPTLEEVARLPEGSLHLSFLSPLLALDVVHGAQRAARDGALVRPGAAHQPRAVHGRPVLAGHRVGLPRGARRGATDFDRFFPLLTTAAGTIRPAKVLVMGVGVAGLQAIATAKRLGAKVRAYDVRSAAKEEAESAGATFVKLARDRGRRRRLRARAHRRGARRPAGRAHRRGRQRRRRDHDRGRAGPQLADPGDRPRWSRRWAEGSLVVDMAADGGGNCELTVAGEVVDHGGVRVVGMANPPAADGRARELPVRQQRAQAPGAVPGARARSRRTGPTRSSSA